MGHKPAGSRHVEQVLRAGTMLTAVGELSGVVDRPGSFPGALRPGGLLMVLRAPAGGGEQLLLSRRPLAQLLKAARDEAATCRYIAITFTAVGAVLLLTSATRRVLDWLRQRTYRCACGGRRPLLPWAQRLTQCHGAAALAACSSAGRSAPPALSRTLQAAAVERDRGTLEQRCVEGTCGNCEEIA